MILLLAAAASLDASSISPQAQGLWAPVDKKCTNEVQTLRILPQSLEWYDATGYLLLGKAFEGAGAEEGSMYARVEGTFRLFMQGPTSA